MHLTEAEVVLFLDGKVAAQERQHIHAHLATCASCRALLGAVHRMPEALAQHDPPPVDAVTLRRAQQLVQASPMRRRQIFVFPRPVFGVLALVLAVGIGWGAYERQQPVPEAERLRSTERPAALTIIEPLPQATIETTVPVFRWQAWPQASGYWLKVHHEDGTERWRVHTSATSLAVPDSLALEMGERYLWHIEATLPNGSTVSSALHSFILSDPHGE